VQTVPGCDFCGVSLRRGDGRVDTPASTHRIVDQADELQYELGEGPCLDAIWVDDTYVIDNMLLEERWPQWAPKAAALGLRSILSVRLATPRDLVGGLNLYSADVAAFDDDAVVMAHIYAAHATNAIAATSEVDHLRTALQSRHQIGVAQGLLMQRYGLSEEAAFQVLSRHSQNSNVRLRDVAAQLVAEFKKAGRLG
jgi:GAF domain-containing protein